MKCTITIEVTKQHGGEDHVAVTVSPNESDLPPGTLSNTVSTLLRVLQTTPGWQKTLDIRRSPTLRLTGAIP